MYICSKPSTLTYDRYPMSIWWYTYVRSAMFWCWPGPLHGEEGRACADQGWAQASGESKELRHTVGVCMSRQAPAHRERAGVHRRRVRRCVGAASAPSASICYCVLLGTHVKCGCCTGAFTGHTRLILMLSWPGMHCFRGQGI